MVDTLNKNYWDNFYKQDVKELNEPSSFAKFVLQFLPRNPNLNLLELGCGNGRDLKHFLSYYNSVGLEISETVVDVLRKNGINNILIDSMTNIHNFCNFDIYYSRFSIHAMTHEDICKFFTNLENIKSGSFFLMETRSVTGTTYESLEYFESNFCSPVGDIHKRTLLNINYLKSLFSEEKFKILFEADIQGVAKFKEEDPYVIRIILQRI